MPVPLFWRTVYRVVQHTLYYAAFLLPWRRPQMIKGPGSLLQIPGFVKKKSLKHALVVTDAVLVKLGLVQPLLDEMNKEGLSATVFSDVTPNPTIDQVEKGLELYKANGCDHIIAVGGGSPLDCAKMIGARSVRPRTPVQRLKGLFRVMWKLPPLFAVPTTAGTGSECTLAAVVVDAQTHEKYAVMDPFIVPPYAVLDPQLTTGLPPFVTAMTGMDTLTHAVEAYIGLGGTRGTERDALESAKLVFGYLKRAYDTGNDLEAREKMQEAAHLGGLAFTRAYVGNVHALAHQLGGVYDVPHGYANAVLLPHVLERFGSAVHGSLARMATHVGIGGATEAEKAANFIQAIKDLNASMKIPTRFSEGEKPYKILPEDYHLLASRAVAEANPLYPVPVIWGEEEFIELLKAAS